MSSILALDNFSLEPLSPNASPSRVQTRRSLYAAIENFGKRATEWRKREHFHVEEEETPEPPKKKPKTSNSSAALALRLKSLTKRKTPFTAQEFLQSILTSFHPVHGKKDMYETQALVSLSCGYSDEKSNIITVARELREAHEFDREDFYANCKQADGVIEDEEMLLLLHQQFQTVCASDSVSRYVHYLLTAVATVKFMTMWQALDEMGEGGKRTKTEHIEQAFANDKPLLVDNEAERRAYRDNHAKIITQRRILYDAFQKCGSAVLLNPFWHPMHLTEAKRPVTRSNPFKATFTALLEEINPNHSDTSSQMLFQVLDVIDGKLAVFIRDFVEQYM
ncbi:hypothetical protein C8J56DRAFT_1168921 [Mycena floridula]|nr:hypothetical protein C8J56DRAFT_1168921 [Mycena floridula]